MEQQARATQTSQPRYLGLQVLRAVAALAVVLYHATVFVAARMHVPAPMWHCGANGVDLFFVLSGFVILFSTQRLEAVPGGWKIFAAGRLTRIVPLYWMATLLKIVLLQVNAGANLTTDLSAVSIAKALLFLPARNGLGDIQPVLNVGWTLNLEMFFYALVTLALLFRRNLYWFVGVPLVVLSVIGSLREPGGAAGTLYVQSLMIEFLFGMGIMRAIQRGRMLAPRMAWACIVAGLIALFVFLPPTPPREWHSGWVQGIPAALVVYGIASLEGRLRRIPAWLLFLGDASYAIYLFHGMVGQLSPVVLARLGVPSPTLSVLGTLGLSLGTGCLVYRFVDLPTMRWFKRHVRYHGRQVLHVQATPAKL